MKILKVELTNNEFDTLMDVLKKMRAEEDAADQKKKKWIHDGIYMVNTESGARINKITKRRE